MAATNASRGRASRAHALLHQAVFARTSSAWVHGQVVATRGANIVVQSSEADASTYRATSAIVIDPVTALLIGQCRFPVRAPLEEMQAIHASILGRLLGDDSRPRQTPTRNIVRILDRLVEPEDIPTGNRSCVWISPEDSASHHFPLPHAIDFVFVHESCARRIPKSVRDGIGATFFSPPDTHDQSAARALPSQPSPVARAPSPPSRGAKRPAPSDSFYDSASDEDASCVTDAPTPGPSRDHVVSRDDADRHARIVASLAHDPELLDHYLTVRARQQPSPKRHHVALAGDASKADERTSKFQFLPTSTQEKIFEITMAPLPPGTSAHDFPDSLIAHHAVQFPPHPGVLLRLFALDFGTRGLSVMNMTRLNHLAKIEWEHSSSVNMQNFSAAVGVPSPAIPACIEDVIGAISTLCTYFAAFAAPATVAFGQSLLAFVQQLVGLELWGPLDLKYLVIWTNGRLEHFLNCAARDANDGGTSRLHAVETLCQTHPEFQMIVQLITSQRVAQALQASHAVGASRGTPAATPYGPQERWFRAPDGPRGPRRGGDASSQRARLPQEVIQLIPRQGGKSLCLKSLSQTGCSGARGNPSECFDSNRRHFLPVTLPAPVRDYINANYGGLRADAQHLRQVQPRPARQKPAYTVLAGRVQAVLQLRLDAAVRTTHQRVLHALVEAGLVNAPCAPDSIQFALSNLVHSRKMSLPAVVQLVRGETVDDPRPNKALEPSTYRRLLSNYEHVDLMVAIATGGVRVGWLRPCPRQSARPANHRSADRHAPAVSECILEGVKSGTYLVLDHDLLDHFNVHVTGSSVNDFTLQCSLPPITYESVAALAQRIEYLHHRHPGLTNLLLKGDVKGAFWRLRQYAGDVHWMGGIVPADGSFVVDMSAPFGWTGSPASMSPGDDDDTPFFQYEWVDDHVLIEVDVADRCRIAEDVLRLAMLAVLGPQAINESKFSTWSTTAHVLGLDWDSVSRSVAMPATKIEKALPRVVAMCRSPLKVPTVQLQRLFGSLRHVSSCLRAARPFYQRLHSVCARAPRYGLVTLATRARDDLRWFERILQCEALHGVPTRLFTHDPPVDVHFYMDASNEGLSVLDPASRRYIVVRFDAHERAAVSTPSGAFDINVREHFAIALSCLLLGPLWRDKSAVPWPHIRCWTDNTTAAARTNKLSAQHLQAQELNRCRARLT